MRNVKILIVSQYGAKAYETFEKCVDYIDFLTEYTEFGGPTIKRIMNKNTGKGVIKAGTRTKEGIEKGRKTEIYTVSLNNKPDAASGAGCVRVIFEEAGMITELDKAWAFTEPTLKAGNIYKGIGIIFGTGGEMTNKKGEKGSSMAFSKMFNDPQAYGLADYKNIYDMGQDSGNCGLFFNITWLGQGDTFVYPDDPNTIHYGLDSNGNSRAWVSEIALNKRRKIEMRQDRSTYETRLTQYCKTPREAFLILKGNVFPVGEIEGRLDRLLMTDDLRYLSTTGELYQQEGKVKFRADVAGKLKPIDRFPASNHLKDREGALVVYEHPKSVGGEIPLGAYLVSIDPIGIDSEGGQSLTAIYVVKSGSHPLEVGDGEIVAQYVGRSKVGPVDHQNKMLYLLSEYYNAVVTHENDRTGKEVRSYFIENNAYSRLLPPPADLIAESIPNSKTLLRKTGHSMGAQKLKELGEVYLIRWLMEHRGTDPDTGAPIRNLDKIRDIALLQELQNYNRDGNYDRVSAMMGIALQSRQLKFQRNTQVQSTGRHTEFMRNIAKRLRTGETYNRHRGTRISRYSTTDSRLNNL